MPRKSIRRKRGPGAAPEQGLVFVEKSAPPAPTDGGPQRLTANEWAKKHNLNEVAAERAAMRAKKWHDLFTEEEFFELIRGRDL